MLLLRITGNHFWQKNSKGINTGAIVNRDGTGKVLSVFFPGKEMTDRVRLTTQEYLLVSGYEGLAPCGIFFLGIVNIRIGIVRCNLVGEGTDFLYQTFKFPCIPMFVGNGKLQEKLMYPNAQVGHGTVPRQFPVFSRFMEPGVIT